MFGNQSNPRAQGVRQAASGDQPQGRMGAPNTIHAVAEVRMFMVGYCNEKGVVIDAAVVQVGDKFYMPPASAEWAKSLKPVNSWFKDQLERLVGQPSDPSPEQAIPAQDDVSVIGEGG